MITTLLRRILRLNRPKMNEKKAREILANYITADNSLYCVGHWLNWTPGRLTVEMDSTFEPDELEAIAWWVINMKYPAP